MSEPPQAKLTKDHVPPSAPSEEEVNGTDEQVHVTLPSTTATPPPTATTETPELPTQQQQPELTGPVKTLKDAFPDLDVEVIETILDSQGGNLDAAFEVLLGMSDPSYKPEPQQTEGLDQMRQDEEYARRLAREGDAHLPQNNNSHIQQQQDQPLFNFQEELPIIKEKVIEAGTAAKNKIMNLYNQFIAGPSSNDQQNQQRQGGILETGMGNLSLSDNQPPQPPRKRSVDLYEWDGQQQQSESPIRNPLLRKQSITSTPAEQLLSDEEFARQLAREDAEASALATSPVRQDTHAPPVNTSSPKLRSSEAVKSSFGSDHGEGEPDSAKPTGYTIAQDVDDDLDDLFDKNDSNIALKLEDGEGKTLGDKDK